MPDALSAVRYLLANNAGVTAEVAAARIMAGVIPQGTALPAIGISHVSTVRREVVKGGESKFNTTRVQITVHAATYPKQRSVLRLVRAALPRSRGTVNGTAVDAIVTDLEGPDFRDDEAGIFMGTQDYIVTWTE